MGLGYYFPLLHFPNFLDYFLPFKIKKRLEACQGVHVHSLHPFRTRQTGKSSLQSLGLISSHRITHPVQPGSRCHQDRETTLPKATLGLHVAESEGHVSDLIPLALSAARIPGALLSGCRPPPPHSFSASRLDSPPLLHLQVLRAQGSVLTFLLFPLLPQVSQPKPMNSNSIYTQTTPIFHL